MPAPTSVTDRAAERRVGGGVLSISFQVCSARASASAVSPARQYLMPCSSPVPCPGPMISSGAPGRAARQAATAAGATACRVIRTSGLSEASALATVSGPASTRSGRYLTFSLPVVAAVSSGGGQVSRMSNVAAFVSVLSP